MRFLGSVFALSALLAAPSALAQTPNGECTGSSTDPACGAPDQSGGGCGCGGGSILINFTDQGDSYQYADDYDDDAWEDNADNCPFTNNPDQLDSDGDGRGDACDLCVAFADPEQRNSDGDALGDGCDDDDDDDGVLDVEDNCVTVPNPRRGDGTQANVDGDAQGDACDADDDADGCEDVVDNCPLIAATSCQDTGAVVPNECFADEDADQIPDHLDVCPGIVDPSQDDADEDGVGDACDQDLDNDGFLNHLDLCRNLPTEAQVDSDRDGRGDECDPRFCFVIDRGDEDDCLDPTEPFRVKAGPTLQAVTGQPKLLHLFSNRPGKAIRYSWTISERPDDGAADVVFPKGAASYAEAFETRYEPGREPAFTARVPGIYKVTLLGELAFDDDEYPGQTVSKDEVTIEVAGEPVAGCRCVPTSGAPWSAAALLLGLTALAARRRRR